MTDHRRRAPMAARTLALAPIRAEATDLFDLPAADVPHPLFAERAAIWRDQRAGLLSIAEAQRRSAALGAAVQAPGPKRASVPARPRRCRPSPNESRQYAGDMATTAARDDRLTPNAKALLQVLRARCGNGRTTRTTKATLAAVLARSMRTIRRYLGDLEVLGYVTTETARNGRGLHLGLVVTITEKVLPFFAGQAGLAQWLAETRPLAFLPFAVETPGNNGVTLLSPKNQIRNLDSLNGRFSLRRGMGARWKPPE